MATLVKKHNKYYIRVRLPGGKEKTIATQTGNKREAERRLRLVQDKEILLKARLITEAEMEDLELQNAVMRFVKERKANGRRPATINSYQRVLDCLVDTNSPRLLVNSITNKHIRKMIDHLHKEKLSDTTVNIYIRSVNAFTNWLFQEGYILEKVKVAQVKINERLPKFLTADELVSFYEQVDNPKWYSTFKVFERLGLRVSELQYSILEEGYVTIPAEHAKSRRSRMIPISADLIPHYQIAMDSPYKPNSITHAFRSYADDAEISSDKSLHSLRHTFALRSLVETNNIVFVKDLLGHQDIKTTMIYTKYPADFLMKILKPKPEEPSDHIVAQA
jgi:integrase/recombinase XerD